MCGSTVYILKTHDDSSSFWHNCKDYFTLALLSIFGELDIYRRWDKGINNNEKFHWPKYKGFIAKAQLKHTSEKHGSC